MTFKSQILYTISKTIRLMTRSIESQSKLCLSSLYLTETCMWPKFKHIMQSIGTTLLIYNIPD